MAKHARRAPRRDENEPEIIAVLRKAGCTVESLDGDGLPDLLVGRAGSNYLLEVKDGSKAPSKRKLTPSQVDWHEMWEGQVTKVETVEQALVAVGLVKYAEILSKQHGEVSE